MVINIEVISKMPRATECSDRFKQIDELDEPKEKSDQCPATDEEEEEAKLGSWTSQVMQTENQISLKR